MILLLQLAVASPCESPTTAAQLEQQLSAAEASFASMSREGFETSVEQAEHTLECLGEVLLPRQAASYHRVMALEAYLAGDSAGTQAAYHAALSLQPAWILPTAYAPEGHPLRLAYESASHLAPSPTLDVDIDGAAYRVDGGMVRGVPTGRPAIVQAIGDPGTVLWSTWHLPGEPLAESFDLGSVNPPVEPVELPVAPDPVPREPAPRWLYVSAAGAGAAAAGFYVYANSQASLFEDLDTPYEDLEELQRRANAGTLAAGGAATVALGFGTAALVLTF